MKVARKLTLALIAGIFIVHAASAAIRIQREHEIFEHDVSRDALVLGQALGHAVEKAWSNRGKEDAMEIIRHATREESHVYLRWIWLDARPGQEHASVAHPDALEPLRRGEPVVARLNEGDESLLVYVPVEVPGVRPGAIEVRDPLTDEKAYVKRSLLNASISALSLVLVCALIAWFLGYYFIGRPVKRLVKEARRIGRGDLVSRSEVPGGDELAELAREMSQMSDNLRRARDDLEAETESRIRAIEQLRHADRLTTVGTMASGIAHQLGTPINVIEGHAQLIDENPESSEDVLENTQVMRRQCHRMAEIIRHLLDFARRGGDREASADVREVARDTLRLVEPILKKKDIETVLDEDLEPQAAATVRIDFNRLQQALTNIIINGSHAMPDGGQIFVGIERCSARPPGEEGPEATCVALTVEDTGVGMEPETVSRIFEPFFTTKEVGEGTGLGLSVTYGIIEDHGGWVDVKSEPGRGSRFTIYLPPEA